MRYSPPVDSKWVGVDGYGCQARSLWGGSERKEKEKEILKRETAGGSASEWVVDGGWVRERENESMEKGSGDKGGAAQGRSSN